MSLKHLTIACILSILPCLVQAQVVEEVFGGRFTATASTDLGSDKILVSGVFKHSRNSWKADSIQVGDFIIDCDCNTFTVDSIYSVLDNSITMRVNDESGSATRVKLCTGGLVRSQEGYIRFPNDLPVPIIDCIINYNYTIAADPFDDVYASGDTLFFITISGDTVSTITGGGVTGTGNENRTTYWDTDTTLAATSITYSATEWDAVALTGALGLPSGTTLQRPAGVAGKMRFDSDLGDLQFYNGSAWRSLPESSANAFTAGQFIIANPAGILSDTTAAGALSMMGGTSGSGASPQVAYWSGASTLTGHANFLWDGTDLSVGTTSSSYTLSVGTGGVYVTPQSAAVTGVEGAGYWDSDAPKGMWWHDGTAFRATVWGDAPSWASTRIPYSDGAKLVTASNFLYDGDQMAVNSTSVETASALVVNGNIRSRNSAGTGTGEYYLHHTREDIYAIDTDDALSLHTNDLTSSRVSFYYGNTKFAHTSLDEGFRQTHFSSLSTSASATVTFMGNDASSGAGGIPILRGGTGSSSNDNGGNVQIYGGRNKSENFSAGYTGVPGHTIIYMWSDTNATAASSFHRALEVHSGLTSAADFGRVQFHKYGDGARTGTPTYYSAWDTDGKFVEVSPASFGIVGAISTSTDGSGDVTVTHSMGTTPTAVLVTPTGTTAWIVSVHTIGATTFKVRFYDAAGAAVTSTAVTATWLGKT